MQNASKTFHTHPHFCYPFLREQTTKWATGSQINYTRPIEVKQNPHWVKQTVTVLYYSTALILFRQFHVQVPPCKTKLNHFPLPSMFST
jgi:hypothetical protein